MSTINIFIVKDTLEEGERLRTFLESKSYTVVGISNSFREALLLYPKLPIDILIIDMFLDANPDGIRLVESISNSKHQLKPFIFLAGTTHKDVYERVRRIKPFSILNKPFHEMEILYSLHSFQEELRGKPTLDVTKMSSMDLFKQDFIFVRKKNALHKLAFTDILFVEVENRYCNIITEKEKYVVLISLGKVRDFLDTTIFLQTHRKYIVNITAIEQIILKDNLLILKGNHRVTISTKYKNILRYFTILR